jgi:hypothetical protein
MAWEDWEDTGEGGLILVMLKLRELGCYSVVFFVAAILHWASLLARLSVNNLMGALNVTF